MRGKTNKREKNSVSSAIFHNHTMNKRYSKQHRDREKVSVVKWIWNWMKCLVWSVALYAADMWALFSPVH